MEDVNMAEEHQSVARQIVDVLLDKLLKPIDCRKCELMCNTKISEEARSEVCREFHSLNLERQRYFILRLVTKKDPQEQKGDNIQKTSGTDYEYYIYYKWKHRVCEKFFLATLCISPEVVNNVLLGQNEYGFFVEEDTQDEQVSSEEPRADLLLGHEDTTSYEALKKKDFTENTLQVSKMYPKYLDECNKQSTAPLNQMMFQQYISKGLPEDDSQQTNSTQEIVPISKIDQNTLYENSQPSNFVEETLPVNEMYRKYLRKCEKHSTVPLNETMFEKYINKSLKSFNQEDDEDQNIEIFKMYAIENPKHTDSLECGCKNNCDEKISEVECIQIRNEFNELSLPCRNDFLLSMVQECNNTLRSYFIISKNYKHRVCKFFFQRTFNIRHSIIDKAFRQRSEFGTFKENLCAKHVTNNRKKLERLKFLRDHIESFPEVYNAISKNPPKQIILGKTLSIRTMYQLYLDRCKEARLQSVSEATFKRYLMKNYDYVIKKPTDSKLLSIPPNTITNPTIVKYEIEIDDTNNDNLQNSYVVDTQGTEVFAGSDCFTIHEIKSEVSE